MSTRKYQQIVSGINEVRLIKPLAVIQPDRKKPEYLVLDGHLRVLALKELGMSIGPCLFAKDDETFSYSHNINRLSTIAEHYLIRRAIDRRREQGTPGLGVQCQPEIRELAYQPDRRYLSRSHQLAARQAVHPRRDPHPAQHESACQLEAVEVMIASSTITVEHVEALLKATPPE